MAVTITTDDAPSTGLLTNVTSMNPNLKTASGTWDANGATKGNIDTDDTGMTYIIAAGINVDEAVSATPAWAWNEDEDAATSEGVIGLQDFEDDTNNTGTWWAIGF